MFERSFYKEMTNQNLIQNRKILVKYFFVKNIVKVFNPKFKFSNALSRDLRGYLIGFCNSSFLSFGILTNYKCQSKKELGIEVIRILK
jgi:hypothetical protein